jgi:hypothetical protein
MAIIVTILLCVSLVAMAHQDLVHRAISWPWFIVVAFASFYIGQGTYVQWGINLLFLLLQASILLLYLTFRYGRMVNPLRKHIGIGDLLFLVAIVPAFAPFNFMLFVIGSMTISLLFHWVASHILEGYDNERVPLAGFMGLNMLVLLFVSRWINFNWADDSYILKVMGN